MEIIELDEILNNAARQIKEIIINELITELDTRDPNEVARLNKVDELNNLAFLNPNHQNVIMPDLRQAMLVLVRRNMHA